MLRWTCSILFALAVLIGAVSVSHYIADASVVTAEPAGN